LFDHFDFVVAIICVDVFQHHTVVIPLLESICFGHTTLDLQEATNGSGIHAEIQRSIGSLQKLKLWKQVAFDRHGESNGISSASWVHAKLTNANAGCQQLAAADDTFNNWRG
jgi:hypothetical protein